MSHQKSEALTKLGPLKRSPSSTRGLQKCSIHGLSGFLGVLLSPCLSLTSTHDILILTQHSNCVPCPVSYHT